MHGTSCGIWDDRHMKIQGLIAAAGRSSRMDGFKPLMELNGFPMIRMTVQSFKNAGIRDITVVTGCRHEELETLLWPLGVETVENSAYQETDMFASVRLGLSHILEKCGAAVPDAVFFLPGDIPLVSPESMKKMKQGILYAGKDTQALLPMVKGEAAHPPVLLAKGLKPVLHFQGKGGLQGALASLNVEKIELLSDAGALADADYRSDFEKLAHYARCNKGISGKLCENLYDETDLPGCAREHGLAVGKLAGWMAERLVDSGACLDVELCRSGGYLHGLSCSYPSHIEAEDFLRKRGYMALANIVKVCGRLECEGKTVWDESVLVCLADRMIHKNKGLREDQALKRLLEEFEVMTGERL